MSAFLQGRTKEWGPELSTPPDQRPGGRHFHSCPPELYRKHSGNKSSQEQTEKITQSSPALGKGGTIPSQTKSFESHCNKSLPKKITTLHKGTSPCSHWFSQTPPAILPLELSIQPSISAFFPVLPQSYLLLVNTVPELSASFLFNRIKRPCSPLTLGIYKHFPLASFPSRS